MRLRLLPLLLLFAGSLPVALAEEPYVSKPIPGGVSATEGPVVLPDGTLYFCSITGTNGETFDRNVRGSIGVLRPGAEKTEVFMDLPEGMRFNGMRLTPWGTILAADSVGKSIVEVNPETKELTTYFKLPDEGDRPNDLTILKDGTIYVSVPPRAIWKIWKTEDGKVEGKQVGESFANGLAIHPDEDRLVTQNGAWTFGEDGMLVKDDSFRLEIPRDPKKHSFMDGMRFDRAGNLYMTRAGAKQGQGRDAPRTPAVIHIFGPDGKLIRNVELPFGSTTNLAFGGEDGKTVYTVHGEDGVASFRSEEPGRSFKLYD